MSEQSDPSEWNGLRFSSADQSSLWIHMIRKGHVRLGTKADFEARNSTIAEIAGRVKRGSFAPHNLGFLCAAKGNGVPRFIPVLDLETTCVFYACIRAVDEKCASFAVPGTYGGWSLGGKRREIEQEQILGALTGKVTVPQTAEEPLPSEASPEAAELSNEIDLDYIPAEDEVEIEIDDGSAPSSPYNKAAWLENWQEYWKVVALVEEEADQDQLFVSFDIANFYDSVDLVRLRRTVQDKCPDQMHVLDVLEFFLSQWNKSLRFYQPSSKGVPMDMVGDMSRVLANFYLVGFDQQLKDKVNGVGGAYVRWADDMTLTCRSMSEAVELIYFAGARLHDIGLNINTSKVKVRSHAEFKSAWGFLIMDALQDPTSPERGIALLRERWDDSGFDRKETALRRSITLLAKHPELKEEREWAFQAAKTWDGFATRITNGQMWSLIECATDQEEYTNDLIGQVIAAPFTDPKAHLLRCLERRRSDKNTYSANKFEEVRTALLNSGHPIMSLAAKHSPYESKA